MVNYHLDPKLNLGTEYMSILSEVDKEKERVKQGSRLGKLIYIFRGIGGYIYYNYWAFYFNRKDWKYYELLTEATKKHTEIQKYINQVRQ